MVEGINNMTDSDDSERMASEIMADISATLDSDGQVSVTIPPIEDQPQPEISENDRLYDAVRDIVPIREMYEKLLDGKDQTIANLERQIAELTAGLKDGAEEHSFVECEEGVEPAPEPRKRDTLTGMPALRTDITSPEYIDQLTQRIGNELREIIDSSFSVTSQKTAEWASKYGRKFRNELYSKLTKGTQGKISDKEATVIVTDLVGREVLVEELFKDFKDLSTFIDDKIEEYVARQEEISSREKGLQVTIERAGEVIEARAAVEQKEAEIESLDKLLVEREIKSTKREEDVSIREENLARREKHLESDLLSFESYKNVFQGYAAKMRTLFYERYSSFRGRLNNIRQEHGEKYGIKGVALIPSQSYQLKLDPAITDKDITEGLSDEKIKQLKSKIIEYKEYKEALIGTDPELGVYMIGPMFNDHGTPVAHFCITGIPESQESIESQGVDPRKIVERSYAKVMLDTYNSVKSSVMENYGALHFLGAHLQYILDQMSKLSPTAQKK